MPVPYHPHSGTEAGGVGVYLEPGLRTSMGSLSPTSSGILGSSPDIWVSSLLSSDLKNVIQAALRY